MDKLLEILQHSLGVDKYGRGPQYRNHFVTGPGSDDWATCQMAVSQGLMTVRTSSLLREEDRCFHVTRLGKDYVSTKSPSPPPAPKLTRSQKRYRAFLDADCGLRFGEWLRSKPTHT